MNDKEMVNPFFDYIRPRFGSTKLKPIITLFGGESLLDTPAHREITGYIVERLAAEDYQLSVVTNGYTLAVFKNFITGRTV